MQHVNPAHFPQRSHTSFSDSRVYSHLHCLWDPVTEHNDSAEILIPTLPSHVFPFPLQVVLLPLLASSLSSGFTGTIFCILQPSRLLHQYCLWQFLYPGSSIATHCLSLASSHSYLWISKLMWVSSMLCALQEIQKNKTSSDKYQRSKCSWQAQCYQCIYRHVICMTKGGK